MEFVALSLGASAVLALIVIGKDGTPFREKWEAENGGLPIHSLKALPAEGEVVPFELKKSNIILPVMLDGDDHLTCWIVDTGYGFSAVDVRLADRLKLPITGTLAVQTLKTDDLKATTVPRGFIFDFKTNTADVELPPHGAVIRDLPNTLENTFGSFSRCLKPGGILGITFLRNFVTRLDYASQTMTFYDPARFVYRGNGTRFTGWLEDEHYFLIPVMVDGVRADMALDTGAFATILTKQFMDTYRSQKGYAFGSSKSGGRNVGTVDASFSEAVTMLRERQMPRIEIGQHYVSEQPVLFSEDASPPGLLSTTRFGGLLGYDVLKHFVIYLIYSPTPVAIFVKGPSGPP